MGLILPYARVLICSCYESVRALDPGSLGGGVPVDMGAKLLCLFLASALVAYYVYIPISEDFEEPWKVMLITAAFRAAAHLVSLVLGLVQGWPGEDSATEQTVFSVALWLIEIWQYICFIHTYIIYVVIY